MFTTPNMGLTAWDLGTDQYDHAQLAANFSQLDLHNHTTGKGVQIPSGGLADNAVTSAKIAANAVVPSTHIPVDSIPQTRLADNSVGTGELLDGSVTTAKLAAGAITADKLDASIQPIGMVVLWFRADSSVLPPSGWEVMDGRAWSTITNKMGAGGVQWNVGNIPNMSNKYALGAALSGTGTAPETPPGIGVAVGQHTRDLSHTHTENAHSHSVNSHTHGLITDGDHNHLWQATIWDGNNNPIGTQYHTAIQRRVAGALNDQVISRQALFIPEVNNAEYYGPEKAVPLQVTGAHNHGGNTTAATTSTSTVTPTINSGLTGDSDFRPASVGFLFIMKVR